MLEERVEDIHTLDRMAPFNNKSKESLEDGSFKERVKRKDSQKEYNPNLDEGNFRDRNNNSSKKTSSKEIEEANAYEKQLREKNAKQESDQRGLNQGNFKERTKVEKQSNFYGDFEEIIDPKED